MTLAGTTITTDDRAAWLEWRSTGIGASEAGAVVGVSPYETALAVYLRKVGAGEPIVESEAMAWGTRLEPAIAEEYSRRTGFSFTAAQVCVGSPTHFFMLATLDRVRSDGRVVELKTVGHRSAAQWGEAGTDEIPAHYLVQVTHQMICTGTEVADVAALIGGQELRIYTVPRDDDIADRIISLEAEFWRRVTDRDPPPVDHGRDGPALARLWPGAEGEVALGPIGEALVEDYEAHGREIRARQESREIARVQLLDLMQDHASARLADGRTLTRRVVSIPERTQIVKPYTYVDMRIRKGNGD